MKASEKLLLTLFAVLLLGGGALVMWDLYRDKRDALSDERDLLTLEMVEIEALLEERDLWMERADWLEENQPPYASRDQIDNAIFEDAQAVNADGVTTSAIQLLDAVETPHYVEASVSLTATGTVEDVFGWLHELQRPEEFRSIRRLEVGSDPEDDALIVCDLELSRWYANRKPQ
ncbi:MAG: hypothetical protein KDN20_00305 [Verrucomicrobiae bacterium]|nr:hypothetical protein [Verrucomicrobiae bacterium]